MSDDRFCTRCLHPEDEHKPDCHGLHADDPPGPSRSMKCACEAFYDETIEQINERFLREQAPSQRLVVNLCESLGYGFVMHEASRSWRMKPDFPGVGMMVGPHEGCTVECEHWGFDTDKDHCEWCCGSGWVTKYVADLIHDVGNTWLKGLGSDRE